MKEFAIFITIVIGLLSIAAIVILIIVFSTPASNKTTKPTKKEIRFNLESWKEEINKREVELQGIHNENVVASYLMRYVNNYGGKLFNNVILEYEPGKSFEIDHIVITKGGFFVIETKGQKGIITGREEDETWHQIKKYYQDDKDLYNPIKQNNSHIYHLRKLFGSGAPKMTSLIIFTEADISYIESNKVYTIGRAVLKIDEITKTNNYSSDYLDKNVNKLNMIIAMYGISKEKHIAYVKNRRA
jgi:hypothetical protein